MLQLDKKTVSDFEKSWVKKIKVFFIEAGCSGTKVDMQTEFKIHDELESLKCKYNFEIYTPKTDKKYLENAKITRVIKADHTGKEKIRYILTSDDIQDRCGCGSSFAFEKTVPKLDIEKLKFLRKNFFKNKK